MTEAFRNRRNAIKEFENSLEKIVEENLNEEETDLIVLLAMVNGFNFSLFDLRVICSIHL